MDSLLKKCLLIYILSYVSGLRHQYTVSHENIIVEYCNRKYMDVKTNIYKMNQTVNALNFTLRLNVDLPEDSKLRFKAFLMVNDVYRVPFTQIDKTFKAFIEMEGLGVQSLCIDYTRPSLVWPLQKKVPYHVLGWTPDVAKLPPNVPEGRFKFEMTASFPQESRVALINWFLKVTYNKQ